MAEGGDDLIGLLVETYPVHPRKLRHLERSEDPGLMPRAPILKTLDFGNPEEKEITRFRGSRLLDGFGSDGFLRAEVAVSGNIAEEVGGVKENGSVSGLPGEGEIRVENFGDGAFYSGNGEEVLGQNAGARQDDRAEEHNEASADDGESSGDDGEEQHAAASENDGEYSPDNREEEPMESFTSSADFSSKCEDQMHGEFQEYRIIPGSAESGQLKAKRRRGSEGEGKTRKKGKNNYGTKGDRGSNISALNKRKLKKEKKDYIQRLHAESQRLIRETCDALFKPVVVVEKPVSSLLEKLRQRKLELKRRNAELFGVSDDITGDDKSERGTNADEDNLNAAETIQVLTEDGKTDADISRIRCEAYHVVEEESFLPSSAGNACGGAAVNATLPEKGVNTFRATLDYTQALPEEGVNTFRAALVDTQALPEEGVNTFRVALDDTQDILCDTKLREVKEDHNIGVLQEEAGLSSSLLNMNLNINFVSQDDESLDENDDKENISPFIGKDDMVCHAKGDSVKVFVHDEAEHDSDGGCLHCDEEEEVENEDEELKDLIVTGDEEMPMDRDKLDILQQKWLQEQDAAATGDLLQRSKCNWNGEPSEGREEESDYEMDRDSISEGDSTGASPTRVVQPNKKLKLDIFKIFPDREAAYVSSDEEEAEQSYLSELVLEKSERKTTYFPPAEDESSREVFGRMKKLDIAPNNKKRPKTNPSFFVSLVAGVNSNNSSRDKKETLLDSVDEE